MVSRQIGVKIVSKKDVIAIVGLGVVGGSFAKAIKKHLPNQYTVIGIDSNLTTIEEALAQGLIDKGTSEHAGSLLAQADVVIICLYPSLVVDFVRTYQSNFKQGALLTDVTGVKGVLIDELEKVVPEHVDFILGHPMAGREKSGLAYASEQVFINANYILTPRHENSVSNIEWLADFIEQLGFKRVTMTDPVHHDEMIAHTSQLSHVLAVALINSDVHSDETIAFVGDSYRDLTRIANMNGELWAELFMANKQALLDNVERFQQELDRLKQAIEIDDKKTMVELFHESSKRRQALEKQDAKLQNKHD